MRRLESLVLLAHRSAQECLNDSGEGFTGLPFNAASDIIYRNNDYDHSKNFPPLQRPPLPDLTSLGLAIDAAVGTRSDMDDGVSKSIRNEK